MSFVIDGVDGSFFETGELTTPVPEDFQTVFAWVKYTGSQARSYFLGWITTSNDRGHVYEVMTGGDDMRGVALSSSASGTNFVTIGTDVWVPICMRTDTSNANLLRVDTPFAQGVRVVGTSTVFGTGARVRIGKVESAQTVLFDGKIAHVAHWNMVLSDDEVNQLVNLNANPLAIQNASLYSYWHGDSLTDEIASYALTQNGTASIDTGDNPTVDPPPDGGFNILSVGGDNQYYPGETNVALALDSAVTLASCTLGDGVTTPVAQPITGGQGTANQAFTSVQGDNPYTKDHNGNQLGSRPKLTFTASE